MRAKIIGIAVSCAVQACVVPLLIAATLGDMRAPVRTVEIDFALVKERPEASTKPEAKKEENRPRPRDLPKAVVEMKAVEPQGASQNNNESMPQKTDIPPSTLTLVTASDAAGETVVHGTAATYGDSAGSVTSLQLHGGSGHGNAAGTMKGAGSGEGYDTKGAGSGEGIAEGSRDYAYIRDAVLKNVKYPDEAARSGIEGRVILSFVVMENGATDRIRVITGSGNRLLDDAAREAVALTRISRKVPYRVAVHLPIVYRLKG
jgi:TonB family protein